MNELSLDFFAQLPRSLAIQEATERIKSKINLGQEKYEETLNLVESPTLKWADEKELKRKIELAQKEGENSEDAELKLFRVQLRETKTIDLFEMPCKGYFEGTSQAGEAQLYNDHYRNYQSRKDKVLTSDESCQTSVPLLLRKCLETKMIQCKDIGCTVTEWDMMDSFKKLDRKYKKKDQPPEGKEQSCRERFLTVTQIVQRLLSSNNFNYQQMVYSCPPLEINKVFKYTLRILWKMVEPGTGGVNNISTIELNRNLIAVGYGDRAKDGTICVWSSKNPHTPEKKIMFRHAVTSTCFSKKNPHWLAAVTEAGDVLIVDVGPCVPLVKVISSSVTNVIKNPLWSVAWFMHNDLEHVKEKVITVGDSGEVLLWDPQSGLSNELGNLTYSIVPHDNMFVHKRQSSSISRGENSFMQSKFRAVDVDLDPTDDKTFYVSTTQGSFLVCTTSKILGPPSPFPAHRGAVLGVKHSPALPLVYLTHGSDAKTLIWVHGVKTPVATLTTDSLDPVLCALWSPSHCSVILTLNRRTVCVWDIRRSDLDPMTILFAEDGVHFTTAVFNYSGTVVFIGFSDGTVTAYNLHEMPHPPFLQKNHLLAAFKKILWRNKTLYEEVNFVLNR